MKNIEIIPAILPQDFDELKQKLALLKDVFLILEKQVKPVIQIDICDGQFVPSKTWPFAKEYQSISQLEQFAGDFDFELDLMVNNPEDLFANFQKNQRLNLLSRSNIRRIIIHNLEALPLKLFGGKASKIFQIGMATPIELSAEEIRLKLDEIDFVQFMGIDKIGYQGQEFNSTVIEKIKNFRKQNSNVIISVDGGVNLENALKLIKIGVNRLVIGSAIFQEKTVQGVAKTLQEFQKARADN